MEKGGAHEKQKVAVVMVPFPAQGHLNQLLHLSRIFSDSGVPVHYVGSAVHNRQAKTRVHGWNPEAISNIHFHDLPLPPFSNPPPDPHGPTKFPDHLLPAFEATEHLRQPFGALLKSLCETTQSIAIIHDYLMAFAAHESTNYVNAEAFVFISASAFTHLFYELETVGGGLEGEIQIPDLPALTFDGCFTERFGEFIQRQVPMLEFSSGRIYNTCRVAEDEYIRILSHEKLLGKRPMWAIGPMNPIVLSYSNGESKPRHKCLEWLDKQPEKSVLYVSFGSNTEISEEQILPLAIGLEQSEQRFIWVVRDADRGDVFANGGCESMTRRLPEGYEERINGRGIIIRDWAPQLEILAHPSTGGFVSHCGWNSCMESMSMGVPIATWPMHSDQPRNAMLMTHVLKVGISAREWSQRDYITPSTTIEAAVRRLMASEEGKDVRKRAEELGSSLREAWLEGGCSRAELDAFIAHISRQR